MLVSVQRLPRLLGALALLGACSSPHYSGSGRRSDLGDASDFSLGVAVSGGVDAGDSEWCPESAADASSAAAAACDAPNGATCLNPDGSQCVCSSLDKTWHCS